MQCCIAGITLVQSEFEGKWTPKTKDDYKLIYRLFRDQIYRLKDVLYYSPTEVLIIVKEFEKHDIRVQYQEVMPDAKT